jgi:hypothetical protein
MSTKSNEELPSIDPSQLSAVTGGVTTDTSADTDLTTMMQQLVASVQDLTQNQGGGSNMMMEMLPIMMMMRSQSAAAAPPIAYPAEIPPPIGNGTGWTLV